MDGELVLIPLMGIMVPITAIIGGVILAFHALKQRAKRAEMEHQERMLALEKGLPLPEPNVVPIKQKNPYFWGFVFLGLGLAIGSAMLIEGDEDWVWGLIFSFVGGAMLLALWMQNRQIKKSTEGVKNGLSYPPNGSGTTQ
ncbi:MAG: hypothetical protein NTW14_01430 [bacterium]|nr:hypothetical protein [bacterium]